MYHSTGAGQADINNGIRFISDASRVSIMPRSLIPEPLQLLALQLKPSLPDFESAGAIVPHTLNCSFYPGDETGTQGIGICMPFVEQM